MEEIHNLAIFVDTHNDILTQTMVKGYLLDDNLKGKAHSDLKRMKEGGLDVQYYSVWSDGNQRNPYDFANRQIDSLYDVTTFPLITEALLEKGYNESDIDKILGGNILRVLKANEL